LKAAVTIRDFQNFKLVLATTRDVHFDRRKRRRKLPKTAEIMPETAPFNAVSDE
jgi:hypothetical protein